MTVVGVQMPVNQASDSCERPVPVFTPEPDSRESSESPESVVSVTSPTLSSPPADLKFKSPRRPDLGVEGRRISLRANHVQVDIDNLRLILLTLGFLAGEGQAGLHLAAQRAHHAHVSSSCKQSHHQQSCPVQQRRVEEQRGLHLARV